MTDNINAFLEADAERTKGEWQPTALAGVVAIAGHVADASLSFNADNDANFIAAASRIAPDIRAMQDAFEQVCEALEMAKHALAMLGSEIPNLKAVRSEHDPRLSTPANYAADLARMAKAVIEPALEAAAPFRKKGV